MGAASTFTQNTVDEDVSVSSRSEFILRTYVHLIGAITAFIAIEALLFATGIAEPIAQSLLGVSWLMVLGGFIGIAWFASRIAHTAQSLSLQYWALAGYVVAEAIIFVPLLYLAQLMAPGAIASAGMVSLLGFAGLSGVVLWTHKDFSFLGGLLKWSMMLALVLICAGVVFGFNLGTYFCVGMVGLAGGAILYDTSNILHHYSEDRYVAAALELFASVALLFWYVLRLFMSRK